MYFTETNWTKVHFELFILVQLAQRQRAVFFLKGRGRKKFKGLPTVSQISSNFVIHGSVCTNLVLKKNGLKNCRFAVTMMFRAMQYEK